ncbi:MAG: hypothetical protein R3321_14975, partial [Nitrososphaeraceae archaeon]|nr:hypothetical protein [Nitrososphaeraceae archaeon]
MVLAGPWDKYWYEYFPDTDTWVKYTWGRKIVKKIEPENIHCIDEVKGIDTLPRYQFFDPTRRKR